jgi:hypothetical protein
LVPRIFRATRSAGDLGRTASTALWYQACHVSMAGGYARGGGKEFGGTHHGEIDSMEGRRHRAGQDLRQIQDYLNQLRQSLAQAPIR